MSASNNNCYAFFNKPRGCPRHKHYCAIGHAVRRAIPRIGIEGRIIAQIGHKPPVHDPYVSPSDSAVHAFLDAELSIRAQQSDQWVPLENLDTSICGSDRAHILFRARCDSPDGRGAGTYTLRYGLLHPHAVIYRLSDRA